MTKRQFIKNEITTAYVTSYNNVGYQLDVDKLIDFLTSNLELKQENNNIPMVEEVKDI